MFANRNGMRRTDLRDPRGNRESVTPVTEQSRQETQGGAILRKFDKGRAEKDQELTCPKCQRSYLLEAALLRLIRTN